jgi:hypothetical protein
MDYKISFTDSTKAPFVVKPYTSNGPANPGAVTPLYSGAVSANTSLVVLGKGMFDYGEPIQKNLVHLLENFANKNRPSYPIEGQLWFKNAAGTNVAFPSDPALQGLYLYSGTTWMQVAVAGLPMSGQLDAGQFKIINVADATSDTDALNKRTGNALYVNVSGDTMTGTLNLNTNRITNVGNAVDPYDALSVSYGDGRYVRVTGGLMFGALDMSNNKVVNVADATGPQDALNLRRAQQLFVSAGPNGSVDGGTY